MNENADLSLKIVIDSNELNWEPSPIPGVDRKQLDRFGGELGRATSIVRYAPGSSYCEHKHSGGEEILVLSGVFSDESGNYPAGSYLRNPPHCAHMPFSKDGCALFVKSKHFHPVDQDSVRVNTNTSTWHQGLVPGLSVMPLDDFEGIATALVRWEANTIFKPHTHPGGEEIFVLEGVFHDEHGTYTAGTWIRSPRYSRHAPFTKSEGALIYVKTGHLDNPVPHVIHGV
ncbi:MAG: cupin [Burkholderiales bacterium 35-55-47]|jgi:anti-sigma factor ChrR (cupin superfamily)|uniref:cupin domain-containing protein n=1 Tax=Limnohabitans sp. TaxID=1907725 RepID=UPI000BCA60D6|nr:cupin domain-containing protein [Limnohabitans sp.]OYY18916.1 MAG: cupin [Burkholderiales bacterium 35-55-47]OYZ73734.1 MAG: cupin [Burkholderiales bacterium 24-55-52]OZB00880.1 MAG: cupin [Burkholderiales bacterium 39-55-53]HQR85333.1 cupin domain-containing protein [Limnohabitans sp.]HQS27259.1 cupin domain-containing protein [Limnohabitans sp.]